MFLFFPILFVCSVMRSTTDNFSTQTYLLVTFSSSFIMGNPLKHVTRKYIQIMFPFQLCHLTLTELHKTHTTHIHTLPRKTLTSNQLQNHMILGCDHISKYEMECLNCGMQPSSSSLS